MSNTDNKLNSTLFAFDSDADGMLSPSEVLLAQLSLGVLLNSEQKKNFESQIGDGGVKYEKAQQLISNVTKGRDGKSEVKQLLKQFDTGNDGTVSLSELCAVGF
jgi:Ca2+-binding EF-hand superfamily protein